MDIKVFKNISLIVILKTLKKKILGRECQTIRPADQQCPSKV